MSYPPKIYITGSGEVIRSIWLGVLIHSVVSDSAAPWTIACQAPLSMGILQAGVLEWSAIPFSRGSSQTRDQPQVFSIAG